MGFLSRIVTLFGLTLLAHAYVPSTATLPCRN